MFMNVLLIRIFICFFIFSGSGFFISASTAQPAPPSDLCVSVNIQGEIELSWITPPNPDDFLNYEIFRNDQALPIIGPSTAESFVDFAANPEQINTYYIQSTLNGVNSVSTDTVSNIVLTLNPAVLSVPQLSWNSPYGDPPASGNYVVYRKMTSTPLEAIASLPTSVQSYNDTLYGFCTDTVMDYQVRYVNAICEMNSQMEENEFRDDQAPPQPIIETVTVDINTGDVIVYWYPVNVPDLNFYRIQHITGSFLNVGNVPGGGLTEFVYQDASTNASNTLGVIAFDDCNNDISFGQSATTMFAEASYTECELDAMVSWSPYEGWDEDVEKYVIRAEVDGLEDLAMGEVDGESLFFLAEVEPNREYCFYIEAHSNGDQRVSHSNFACIGTTYPVIIDYNYISSVNTISDSRIQVDLQQDVLGMGTTYELFRSREGASFVSKGVFQQTNQPVLTYVDNDVDARNLKYRYKWVAYDGCGALISESNVSRNIVLTAIADSRELRNLIEWNSYIGWEGGVNEYQVWRKLGSEEEFSVYANLNGNTLILEDDVEPFMMNEGEFCYMIAAREGSNSFGNGAVSRSNISCATQPPIMWIPSGIVLNGMPENRVFKPVAGFIDFESYRMEIITKWGEKIFQSSDIEDGWDGTYRGNTVREDFYQYIIIYRDGSGKPFVERDIVYVTKSEG